MANPQYGQLIATAFENVVTSKPIEQIFEEFWLFNHLTKKNGGLVTLDGGRNIEFTLSYAANPTFRSITQNETLDTSSTDFIDAATYEWKFHAGTVRWDEAELFKASGESAKYDLLAAKVSNAVNSHKEDLSTALVAATSGNNVSGLQTLIPDTNTSGSPGGISKSTYSWWRSTSQAGTQTSTAFDNLRSSYRTAYNGASTGYSGKHPTVMVSGLAPFAGYEQILVANERITDKKDGDAGFKNAALKYKGATYGYDERIGARCYFLNPDGIKLAVGKGHWMKMGKDIESINSLSYVRKFHSFLQMCVVEPRLLAVVHTIS